MDRQAVCSRSWFAGLPRTLPKRVIANGVKQSTFKFWIATACGLAMTELAALLATWFIACAVSDAKEAAHNGLPRILPKRVIANGVKQSTFKLWIATACGLAMTELAALLATWFMACAVSDAKEAAHNGLPRILPKRVIANGVKQSTFKFWIATACGLAMTELAVLLATWFMACAVSDAKEAALKGILLVPGDMVPFP